MQKAVMLFGQKVEPGGSYDLMTIPYISESDIQHSLLKGTLRNKLSIGEIRVTESNINLVQYSPEFTTFLQSVGITSGISSDGATGVANLSALSQINNTAISNGTAISVVTVLDIYILDNTSTDTIDGIIIVATKSGTGRWMRSGTSNSKWAERETWYIDSVNGNDENVGDTNSTALATFAEVDRRIGPRIIKVFVTINILNDVAESFCGFQGAFPQIVMIMGTQTTIATGTITSITQWDHDPSDGYVASGLITDTALSGDWSVAGLGGTSLLEKKIVITDGASEGAYAYLIADTGNPKEAHVSPWISDGGYSEETPVQDSAYKVVTLPRFTNRFRVSSHNQYVGFKDLQFESTIFSQESFDCWGNCAVLGCVFVGSYANIDPALCQAGSVAYFYNCLFLGGIDLWNTACYLYSGAFKGVSINHVSNSFLEFQAATVFYNTERSVKIPIRDGSHVAVNGGSIGVVVIGSNTDGSVLEIRDNSSVFTNGTVYSIGGSAGAGVWVSALGSLGWNPVDADADTKFSFASATDFNIGETSKTIAEMSTTGFFNTANGARVVRFASLHSSLTKMKFADEYQ